MRQGKKKVRRWKDGDPSEFWFPARCWVPEASEVSWSECGSGSWYGRKETRWGHPRRASAVVDEAREAATRSHAARTEEAHAIDRKPAKKRRKTEGGGAEKEPSETKCRKWRIHPTRKQRATLRLWLDATDAIYNRAARMINGDRRNARIKTLRAAITNAERWNVDAPGRMLAVPYEIRDSPLRDLVKACKALRAKEKRLKRKFKLREQDAGTRSFAVRARQLNCKKASGSVWPKLFGTVHDRTAMRTEDGKTLPLVFEHDCRLLWERKTGSYYFCFPVDVEVAQASERKEVVAVDPGVRTFATCFDALRGRVTEWGCSNTTRILYWLIRKATRLEEKARAAKGRHRRRTAAVAARVRKRSTDLVNELHRKLALWLCERFAVVLLPKFDTRQMAQRRGKAGGRKIGRKTAGGMVRLSHYKFRMHLLHKAREHGTIIELCDERYTSLTCGRCGTLNAKLGSSKTFRCPRCGHVADRDHNAARNVLLRYVWKSES